MTHKTSKTGSASSPVRSAPPRARQAFLDYFHLGPGRTLPALLQRYRGLENPPTRFLGTLQRWSYLYSWVGHAGRLDELEAERAEADFKAQRDAVLQSGLALEHERVQVLMSIYQKMFAALQSGEALWSTQVKALRLEDGSVERVELRRFNGDLVRLLRGLLDDIASETGGRLNRPRQPDSSAKSGLDPNDYTLDVLNPSERAEFLRLQDKIFSNPITRDDRLENIDKY